MLQATQQLQVGRTGRTRKTCHSIRASVRVRPTGAGARSEELRCPVELARLSMSPRPRLCAGRVEAKGGGGGGLNICGVRSSHWPHRRRVDLNENCEQGTSPLESQNFGYIFSLVIRSFRVASLIQVYWSEYPAGSKRLHLLSFFIHSQDTFIFI